MASSPSSRLSALSSNAGDAEEAEEAKAKAGKLDGHPHASLYNRYAKRILRSRAESTTLNAVDFAVADSRALRVTP